MSQIYYLVNQHLLFLIINQKLDFFLFDVDERYLKLDNCFLLPHIGSSNYETRDAMAMLAVKNINAFFKNDPLPTKVK